MRSICNKNRSQSRRTEIHTIKSRMQIHTIKNWIHTIWFIHAWCILKWYKTWTRQSSMQDTTTTLCTQKSEQDCTYAIRWTNQHRVHLIGEKPGTRVPASPVIGGGRSGTRCRLPVLGVFRWDGVKLFSSWSIPCRAFSSSPLRLLSCSHRPEPLQPPRLYSTQLLTLTCTGVLAKWCSKHWSVIGSTHSLAMSQSSKDLPA